MQSLLSGKRLARNTVINLAAQAVPLLVGLIAIPILVRLLGVEQFGLLTLLWLGIGYFTLFDLGLGKSLTKFVADQLGRNNEPAVPELVWTALTMMVGLGVVSGGAVFLFAEQIITELLNVPEALQQDAIVAFQILGLSIPIVVSTVAFRGVLQAYQEFASIAAARIPLGIWNFVGPIVALQVSEGLTAVAWALIGGRILVWVAFGWLCLRRVPKLTLRPQWNSTLVKPLLSFGGWLTVSSIVGPVLVYADRLMVASTLTVTALAYYATPHEIIIKLLLAPIALVGVMFPAFSTSWAGDFTKTRMLYKRSLLTVLLTLLPAVVFLIIYAKPLLNAWLGAEFAVNSALIAQVLLAGVFINGLGLVSQAFIQSTGRSDLTAKLHLAELPLFLSYLYVLMQHYGVVGAAMAWLLRVTLSTIALAVMAELLFNRRIRETTSLI